MSRKGKIKKSIWKFDIGLEERKARRKERAQQVYAEVLIMEEKAAKAAAAKQLEFDKLDQLRHSPRHHTHSISKLEGEHHEEVNHSNGIEEGVSETEVSAIESDPAPHGDFNGTAKELETSSINELPQLVAEGTEEEKAGQNRNRIFGQIQGETVSIEHSLSLLSLSLSLSLSFSLLKCRTHMFCVRPGS